MPNSESLTKRYRAHYSHVMDALNEQVSSQLKALQLPVNPMHFTVMYEYLAQLDPAFSKKVAQAIDDKTYDNNTAETLFFELVSQLVYQKIPAREIELMLSDLIGNLENWSSNTENNHTTITSEITLLLQQALPSAIKASLEEKILPSYQEVISETQQLERQVNEAINEVQSLEKALQEARSLAKLDELTQLPNRRRYNEVMQQALEQAHSQKKPLSLIVLDLDYFKVINDDFGHLVGDSVLRYLARLLQTETKGKDLVARIGGEEFAILLEDTHFEDSFKIAEKIRAKIDKSRLTVKNQKKPLRITASFGIASLDKTDTPETLFERADKALYKAKHSGRNCVC